MPITTIGYEGLRLSEFIEMLSDAGIHTVIDVRELPLSRKKGFSKKALAKELAENNIEYVHMRRLGCPKSIRHDYRDDKDWDRYTVRYMAYLNTQEDAMGELSEFVAYDKKCCLLCFEENAYECHRSLVTQSLKAFWLPNLKINHLRTDQIMTPAEAETMPL
ncbi:MAG: DUF488 domain-containing protein [Caldilineaceae bacterium]|nr:DUF488 domain-containing protein [Caldilineaceae bacterium]